MSKLSVTIRAARLAFAAAVAAALISGGTGVGITVESENLQHRSVESSIACANVEKQALDFASQYPSAATRLIEDDPSGHLFESDDEYQQCPELRSHIGDDVRTEIAISSKSPQ